MKANGPPSITYLNDQGDPFWPHRIRLPFRVKLEDKTWAEPGTLLLLDSGKAQRAQPSGIQLGYSPSKSCKSRVYKRKSGAGGTTGKKP